VQLSWAAGAKLNEIHVEAILEHCGGPAVICLTNLDRIAVA
jgi:hypothetical protein